METADHAVMGGPGRPATAFLNSTFLNGAHLPREDGVCLRQGLLQQLDGGLALRARIAGAMLGGAVHDRRAAQVAHQRDALPPRQPCSAHAGRCWTHLRLLQGTKNGGTPHRYDMPGLRLLQFGGQVGACPFMLPWLGFTQPWQPSP